MIDRSYLPFQSAREYQDTKMQKWMGFFLSELTSALSDVINKVTYISDLSLDLYVLECADGSLYIGYTTDVEKRLATHNRGKGAKYTRARLPVSLLYQESFASKQEAMSAEALFKKRNR